MFDGEVVALDPDRPHRHRHIAVVIQGDVTNTGPRRDVSLVTRDAPGPGEVPREDS